MRAVLILILATTALAGCLSDEPAGEATAPDSVQESIGPYELHHEGVVLFGGCLRGDVQNACIHPNGGGDGVRWTWQPHDGSIQALGAERLRMSWDEGQTTLAGSTSLRVYETTPAGERVQELYFARGGGPFDITFVEQSEFVPGNVLEFHVTPGEAYVFDQTIEPGHGQQFVLEGSLTLTVT